MIIIISKSNEMVIIIWDWPFLKVSFIIYSKILSLFLTFVLSPIISLKKSVIQIKNYVHTYFLKDYLK